MYVFFSTTSYYYIEPATQFIVGDPITITRATIKMVFFVLANWCCGVIKYHTYIHTIGSNWANRFSLRTTPRNWTIICKEVWHVVDIDDLSNNGNARRSWILSKKKKKQSRGVKFVCLIRLLNTYLVLFWIWSTALLAYLYSRIFLFWSMMKKNWYGDRW